VEVPPERVVKRRLRIRALADGDPVIWTRSITLSPVERRRGVPALGRFRITREQHWQRARMKGDDRVLRYLGSVIYRDEYDHEYLVMESMFAAPFVLTDGDPSE
jgi:hypothetical protein